MLDFLEKFVLADDGGGLARFGEVYSSFPLIGLRQFLVEVLKLEIQEVLIDLFALLRVELPFDNTSRLVKNPSHLIFIQTLLGVRFLEG
jgi:hypothetical protein